MPLISLCFQEARMLLKINGLCVIYSSRSKIILSEDKSLATDYARNNMNHIFSSGVLYRTLKKQINDGLKTPTNILLEYPDAVKDVTEEFIKKEIIRRNVSAFPEKLLKKTILENIEFDKIICISEKFPSFSDYKKTLYNELKTILQPNSYVISQSMRRYCIGLIKGIESDFSIFKLAFSDVYNFEVLNVKTKEELEQEIKFLRNVK